MMVHAKKWKTNLTLVLIAGVVAFGAKATPGGNSGTVLKNQISPRRKATLDYTLSLGERRFDPLVGVPEVAPGWTMPQVRGDGYDLRLIQMKGPIEANWIETLAGGGVEVVQYIHPYTYIVWCRPGDLTNMGRERFVRWMGDFVPAYRVLPQSRGMRGALNEVSVLMYRGANTDDIVRSIMKLGGLNRGRKVLNEKYELASFSMDGVVIQTAASIPGVYSIQLQPTDGGVRGEMSNQVNVGNISGFNAASPGYQAWLSGVGLDGTGVIIASVDSGMEETHPDLVNRVLPCVGDTCGGTAVSSHGTHTAGIIAADGSSGVVDANGFLRGQGVAPGVNLIEQVFNPTYTQPGGMLKLMTQSQANGAFASSNSWGPAGTPQGYDNATMQVDIGVRDADPITPGNQPLVYVLSFMNGNGGVSSQGSPDEAKNIFTIGSTKIQTVTGQQILDINDISSNSAHGPAMDGRTIPHMVAPGCYVDSTVSGAAGYALLCGTSMASPQVSGGAALFAEYYRGLAGTVGDPSPALVKAAFLPVCHDLSGNLDADGGLLGHPYDSKQGWGRMNLEAVLNPISDTVQYFDQTVVFNATGETWSQTLSAFDPTQPVRVMLVWTDAPGHGLGGITPAWNNDLDLEVDAAGSTYLGNNFRNNGYSVAGGFPDVKNNTEGVFLGPVAPSTFTIRVKATNINSDGVPNVGDGTDQDFALVCYNCVVEPSFVLQTTTPAVDVCAPNDAVYSIQVDSILGFSAPVTLSATGVPTGATVSFSPNPAIPGTTVQMTVGNTGGILPGASTIQVTGVSGVTSRSLQLGFSMTDSIPSFVTLVTPANTLTNVSRSPLLVWDAVAGADEYVVEVATDNQFANIAYTATVTGTSHRVTAVLNSLTEYWWRVRGRNVCGDGAMLRVWSFTTLNRPFILLVDDDDNTPDVRPYYTDALDALGMEYDIWDTANSDNEPLLADYGPYAIVIWFTGDAFGAGAAPGAAGEQAVSDWLDAGGTFIISSQDYFFTRGQTAFMTSHLGVASMFNDIKHTNSTGADICSGLGPYNLKYQFTNWSDRVDPDATSTVLFSGSQGVAAIAKDTGVYRTIYMGIPFSALPSPGEQVSAMSRIVNWGMEIIPVPCPADCSPVNPDGTVGDGIINIHDLIALINAFGSTGGGPCDFAPDNGDGTFGDGVVNIKDLITLINTFGPCP